MALRSRGGDEPRRSPRAATRGAAASPRRGDAQPGPELARVQLAGPARGAGRADAPARAGEVPRDLHLEPGRVLHEADLVAPARLRRRDGGRRGAARAPAPRARPDPRAARRAGAVLRGDAP